MEMAGFIGYPPAIKLQFMLLEHFSHSWFLHTSLGRKSLAVRVLNLH